MSDTENKEHIKRTEDLNRDNLELHNNNKETITTQETGKDSSLQSNNIPVLENNLEQNIQRKESSPIRRTKEDDEESALTNIDYTNQEVSEELSRNLNLSDYCISSDADTEKMDSDTNDNNGQLVPPPKLSSLISESSETIDETTTNNKRPLEEEDNKIETTAGTEDDSNKKQKLDTPEEQNNVPESIVQVPAVAEEDNHNEGDEEEDALEDEEEDEIEENRPIVDLPATPSHKEEPIEKELQTNVKSNEETETNTVEAAARVVKHEENVPVQDQNDKKRAEPVQPAEVFIENNDEQSIDKEENVEATIPSTVELTSTELITEPEEEAEAETEKQQDTVVSETATKPIIDSAEVKSEKEDSTRVEEPHEEEQDAEDEDEVEEEVDQDEEENTGDSEQTRQNAINDITTIEYKFAELRQKLYETKLYKLELELQMCLEGSHPELRGYYEKIANIRDYKLRRAYQRQKYELKCIDIETHATRTFIHQGYHKRMCDTKNALLDNTTQKWYDINKERRDMDIVVPEVNYHVPVKTTDKTLSCITGYAGPARLLLPGEPITEDLQCENIDFKYRNNPVDKLEVIVDRMRLNNELSDLQGLKKYFHSFPGAPSLNSLRDSEINEDFEILQQQLQRLQHPQQLNSPHQ